MLILVGLGVVLVSILAGYVLEHGAISVLLQPAELLIIGGSSIGIILIANPVRNLRRLRQLILSVGKQPRYTEEHYLEALKLMYVLFNSSRRSGITMLERHIEDPASSDIFMAYPRVSSDPEMLNFICDSFRMAIAGSTDPDEVDSLMHIDLAVQRSGRNQPVQSLMSVADSLPGLGIVAAVLGVVVTMQALGGPASEIGQKVAAALVGTFLGILLCYGVVGPLAAHLDATNKARIEYMQVMRIGIVAFLKGSSPILAAESARRSIPVDVRPPFQVMEREMKAKTKAVRIQDMAEPA